MTLADSTLAALAAAIRAAPDEDTPRLQYADRLEELGDAARAEFIRVQVALSKAPDTSACTGVSASWCPVCGDCTCHSPEDSKADSGCPLHDDLSPHAGDLRTRSDALLAGYAAGWFAVPGYGGPELDGGKIVYSSAERPARFRCTVSRGFLDTAHVPLDVLLPPCGRCAGSGVLRYPEPTYGGESGHTCPDCRGTGRTGGLDDLPGPLLGVRVSDREPYHNGSGYCWYDATRKIREAERRVLGVPAGAELPTAPFRALDGWDRSHTPGTRWRPYPTPDLAHAALGRAVAALARGV